MTAWIFGILFICFLTLLDQGTKLLAIFYLKGQSDYVLIPGILKLKYLENRGMAFGMFEGKIPVFIILCIIFFIIFFYVYARIPKTAYYFPMAFVCLIMVSGALGNFIDRIMRGYVVDFIYFSLIDFPVFNMADIYVVCSGISLILLVCLKYRDDNDYAFLKLR